MAKVILLCGKICCGKSTYARHLCARQGGVLLSVDEIMLALFGLYAGDRHDDYAARVRGYLLKKSAELVECGCDVVLDWGFWTAQGRAEAREYYRSRGIPCELRYLDVDDETWKARIARRNQMVRAGEAEAYLVDGPLLAKFEGRFEPPAGEEVDLWVRPGQGGETAS